MRGIRWLALSALLACASALAGVPERPRFRVAGPAQGLPSTDIKALARDADGYLWIGTADGLARHDGIDMRVWRHDPQDPAGLPGNNVQALLLDARDRAWVATEGGGISVLDGRRARFTHYRKATHPQLGSDDVWALARQGDAMWAGTYDGGLTRIDADGAMQRYTREADGLPSDTVLALAVDADGVLWVGTDKGLARQRGERFETVVLPGADGVSMVFSLSPQADGLWAGTSLGIWRHARGRWSQPPWSSMFHRSNGMMSIATDRHGDHWIGTQRGLWRQHGDTAPEPVRTGGVEIPRIIYALLREPDGALWIPVAGRGLGYLRADWRQAARLQGEADGLQGAMYRALAPARGGGAWLAGVNGVVEYLGSDGIARPLDADALARLRETRATSLLEDTAGRLWLGHRRGLLRIGSDGAIDEWGTDDSLAPVPAGMIHHLALAADGNLWLLAVGGGVQQRDPATGRILFEVAAGDAGGLGSADLDAMVIAPGGEPWVAGSDGVAWLDRPGGRFRRIQALGSERVHALAFDGPDLLWVQRLSGLEQYRRDGDGWTRIDRVDARHGMPAVAAAALLVDARHRVWVTTSRGLYRWEPVRRNLRHVGMQDGGGSEEYLDRSALLREDGVLLAGTADGSLVMVDTNAPDPASTRPPLRFDRLAVRRDGEWHDLPMAASVALGRADREVRVRARLLVFDDPPANRYWSRLEGFEGDWVALGASGERVFTGLAPGEYTLRMRAQDAAGNAAPERGLVFVVPPPWWRTTWAQAGFAALLVLAVVTLAWAYRQRLRRRHAWQLAEQKRALAEQASEAKTRFLATLGHEVRTPMTGVLGMSELLQGTVLDARQRNHVDAIRRAGEHLLRLVNDALDLARIEAGKLQLANADFALRPLLDEVAALMAPVAERKGLAFIDGLAADAPVALHGDRTRVQQILLNLVGNAVKFTDTGHVALETLALSPQGVRFVIADTGPGLDAEQQARLFRRFEQADGAHTARRYGGSGLGLSISQELAAAMGGRIAIESAPGVGTRFIVELPLPHAEDADTAIPAPTSASAETHARASLALLLVEDDLIVAEAISGLLQAQGHAVTHAGHGLAALTEVATGRFDAALLDLDLPGMDGLALARMLRAQGHGFPLLAVTARSDGDAEAQAKAAGFDGFLRKPVTGTMLAQALEALAAGTGPDGR
jgi:ligand-binding sensor domain-containing protein/CheY-like chemotaxis protein/nitrogen-specific signal transduction histidine kinase